MSATAIDEAPVGAPGREELPIPEHLTSAWRVLIAGLRLSPELRRGLVLTVVVSLGAKATIGFALEPAVEEAPVNRLGARLQHMRVGCRFMRRE